MENFSENPFDALSNYEVSHLVAHLQAANRINDIHSLLQVSWQDKNAWYMTRVQRGQNDGFIQDVNQAWYLIENTSNQSISNYEAVPSLLLELRYALTLSSIRSLRSNVPPSLAVALMAHGIWSVRGVFDYALNIPRADHQIETLATIASHLPEPFFQKAIEAAVDLAMSFLAPAVETDSDSKCLDYARSLANFAVYLPAVGKIEEAITLINHICFDSLRRRALQGALLTAIEKGDITPAWEAVQKLDDEYDKILISVTFVPYLNDPWRQYVQEQALALITEMTNEPSKVNALEIVAPYISEDYSGQLTVIVGRVGDPKLRVYACSAILSYLYPSHQLWVSGEALISVQQIPDSTDRAYAYNLILPCLPVDYQQKAFEEALSTMQASETSEETLLRPRTEMVFELVRREKLEAALELTSTLNGHYKEEALMSIVPLLAREGREEEALDTAIKMKSWLRVKALIDVFFLLPSTLQERSLECGLTAIHMFLGSTEHILHHQRSAEIIAEFAELLIQVGRLNEAFDLARTCGGYQRRAILEAIAGYLPKNLVMEAMELAERIDDTDEQVKALEGLASLFTKYERPDNAVEVIQLIQETAYQPRRWEALSEIVPLLMKLGRVKEAHDIAMEIPDEKLRTKALRYVAPEIALSLVHNIQDRQDRLNAYIELFPYLSPTFQIQIKEQSEQIEQTLENTVDRAWALANIAEIECEPRKTLIAENALSLILDFEYPQTRVLHLINLINSGNDDMKKDIVTQLFASAKACVNESPELLSKAIMHIVPHLKQTEREHLLGEIHTIFSRAFESSEAYQYNKEKSSTILAVLPYLSGDLLNQAIESGLQALEAEPPQINDAFLLGGYAKTIVRCSTPNKENYESRILNLALNTRLENRRAEMLSAVAPHLSETSLEEALDIAKQTRMEDYRALMLAETAAYVSVYSILKGYIVWKECLHILSGMDRELFWQTITPLTVAMAIINGGKVRNVGIKSDHIFAEWEQFENPLLPYSPDNTHVIENLPLVLQDVIQWWS